MNDPKGGVAKVTCPTFEAMGQIPMFHRTYFLLEIKPTVPKINVRNNVTRPGLDASYDMQPVGRGPDLF